MAGSSPPSLQRSNLLRELHEEGLVIRHMVRCSQSSARLSSPASTTHKTLILTLRSPRTSSAIRSTSHFSNLVRCRGRFSRQCSADLRGVETVRRDVLVVLHILLLLLALRLSPVTSPCTAVALLLLLLLSASVLSG